ncbi:MAG: hypothetical protein NTZ97_04765 [Candidatus Moranbacteria bacterium]|nr:hypothetical protein [Candidatus Moranbacteria bacterium]
MENIVVALGMIGLILFLGLSVENIIIALVVIKATKLAEKNNKLIEAICKKVGINAEEILKADPVAVAGSLSWPW